METEILSEIRDAEKRAEDIIETAGRESERILHDATVNSSRLLAAKEDEIKKAQEKKLMDFREKARSMKEEKLAEGRTLAKQIRAKAEKNIGNAAEFVMRKFEEMI